MRAGPVFVLVIQNTLLSIPWNAEMSVLNRLRSANAHPIRGYAVSHPNGLLRRSFDIV